ncbi:MAG: glycosyltransferase family 2 protein [Planctomycetota bacterium]
MIDLAIVIPTRNAGRYFEQVLAAVRAQSGVAIRSIVVLDSESTDETLAIAERFGAEIVPVEVAHFNHGLVRGEGVRRTRTDLVVLLTQDALLARTDTLARMSAHFRDERVAGVYVRQVARPEDETRLQRRWERQVPQERRIKVQEAPKGTYEDLSTAERFNLCVFDDVCSMIRRSAFDEHPFREAAFAEDRLWARDVIRAGWNIVYDGTIEVIHSHARGPAERIERIFDNHRAMQRYFGYRFVKNPVDFAIYAAKAAYGAAIEAASEGLGVKGIAREAFDALRGAFAALAGTLIGAAERRVP